MLVLSAGIGCGQCPHSFSISNHVTDAQYTVTWATLPRAPFVDVRRKALFTQRVGSATLTPTNFRNFRGSCASSRRTGARGSSDLHIRVRKVELRGSAPGSPVQFRSSIDSD
jgi:hypothetical protein